MLSEREFYRVVASTLMNHHRFYEVLEDWRSRPYNWADANCCQFAADIARCWGVSHEVPRCETPAEAAEWIRAQGVKSLYHYLRKLFGNPTPPLQAKRGWIAYRKGQGLEGSATGAIDRKAMFVGERGLIEIPLAQCACAFDPAKYR